jgi:hypothetical protein
MSRIQKRYDMDLLQTVVERDNITIDIENIKNLSSLVRLDFICKCGNTANKTFRLMYEKGAMCRSCTIILYNERHKASLKANTGFEYALQNKDTLQKKKDTCVKRYKVEHATQSDIIKEKTKQTCLTRYNCEFVSQVKNIREKIKNTWFRNYGVYNPLQCESIKNKSKETCLRKYGVLSASQSHLIKTKSIQTNLIRYGVTSVMKLQIFKDKRIKTCLERYGVKSVIQYNLFIIKRIKTCLERYGVKSVLQCESLKNKSKETCLRKYGVEHISQANIPTKPFKFKIFTFPCGKDIYVQGYEPFALEDLVKEGYNSEDILTCRSEVPKIWYITPDSKRHRYFVDIYIPKENKMIEVKSDYTYNLHQDKIILKAEECVHQGYVYEIWVYDYKKNREILSFEIEN